jgi:dolichol-phosphate mannosyltransferase
MGIGTQIQSRRGNYFCVYRYGFRFPTNPREYIVKLLIVTPTYNEAENIESFIGTVFAYAPPYADLIIIDDNSPDGTAELVEKQRERYKNRIWLLRREGKQGGASAFLEGFSMGISLGYDVFLAMDADFSHDPKYIPVMVERIKDADLVIGSRNVAGGGIENRTFIRNIITKGGSLYSRLILGCPIQDFTGGYNMWRKTVLETIDPETIVSRGYSFQIEMKYRAFRAHFKIAEIPIIFPDRKFGKSKMSKKYFFDALRDVWIIRKTA